MKIQNHAPYQLSNYEVLNHCMSVHEDLLEQANLRQQEKGRSDAQLLLDYPLDFEFRKPDEPDPPVPEDFPEQTEELKVLEEQAKRRGDMDNTRWIADKVIKYLGNWYMPTYRQDPDGIYAMVHELQNHDLSKGEILQVINTVPRQEVEVYTCIQNLEDRYEHEDDQAAFYSAVLDIVNAHTLEHPDEGLPPMTPQSYIPPKGSCVSNGNGAGIGENGFGMDVDGEAAAMNGVHAEEEFMQGEYYAEDDGMMGGDDYVHEAEWGADREGGVDDDVPEND